MNVLIAGASGLIGTALLKQLLERDEIERITVIARRPVPLSSPKLEFVLSDFSKEGLRILEGRSYEAVFCCLGTTIKKAGHQSAFRAVDFEAVLALAQFTAASGSKQFLVVSSLGANSKSYGFYSRVKGEMEDALRSMPIPSVTVVRPSLLLGDRREFRPGEKVGELILNLASPFLKGSLKKYRAIPAVKVARALLRSALAPELGYRVMESDRIALIGAD